MRPELDDLPLPNWFHHGEQILALLEVHKPLVVVELGAYLGGSAIAMARIVRRWDGQVTSIDSFDYGTTYEMCRNNITNAHVDEHVFLLQAKTAIAAENWPTSIDFLYIDADHSYDGCLSDLRLWWPHLKVGGIICGDDYGRKEMNVTEAWNTFEKEVTTQFIRSATPSVDGAFIYGIK